MIILIFTKQPIYFILRIKESHCPQNAEVEDNMYGDLENEEGSDQNSDPEDSTEQSFEATYSIVDSVTHEVKNESELEIEEEDTDTYEHTTEGVYSTVDIATAKCVAYQSIANFSEIGTAEEDSAVANEDP